MTLMNSANFKTIVSPILCEIYDSTYEEHKPEYPLVFTVQDGMKSNQHVEPILSGFGAAPEYTSGTPIEYDVAEELGPAVGLYKEYGLAFALTKTLVEDGEEKAISFAKRYTKELAVSHRETEEIVAQNFLNRAFNNSYPVWDGVSLNNSSHSGVANYTYSNLLSTPASLSQTSLEQMLTQIKQAKDWNGKPISLNPNKLVVPPALMNTANVLLSSVSRTGTANNDINPIKKSSIDVEPAVFTRLTSSTAWWVTTKGRMVEEMGMMFLNRRTLDRDMIGDFETNSMRYKATRRYVPLVVDPKRIYGTTGV